MIKLNGEYQLMESKINCIFYSEFHPVAGPSLVYQVPDDIISKELFDAISSFIIPKLDMERKMMTLTSNDYKIMGYPMIINDSKYVRNKLIFNVCFVCDDWMKTFHYEPIVKKIANYFVTFEQEFGFLSCENTKAIIPRLFEQIRYGLNRQEICRIPVNDANSIHLKIIRVHRDPIEVLDHHVPYFIEKNLNILPTQWDLTTQQILPYMNGYKHVARIACDAEVEVSLVKSCIRNMVYYGLVTILPIFMYSNVYIPTSSINHLCYDKNMQEECLKFVSRKPRNPPTFKAVFTIYCGMDYGITVKDLCLRYDPALLNIDERKLMQFGIFKGLIKRLHKYPVSLPSNTDDTSSAKKTPLSSYFTGEYSYDEICCKTGLSYQQLDVKVEKDHSVVVFWK